MFNFQYEFELSQTTADDGPVTFVCLWLKTQTKHSGGQIPLNKIEENSFLFPVNTP